jgi:hypothetical protein
VCVEAGRRSEVVQDSGEETVYGWGASAYWDGLGRQHIHGGVWAVFYRCSRGHRWMQTGSQGCYTCGFEETQVGPETVVLPEEGARWL